mmetsp:Transcript_18214/g.37240  ORF Transcript_18214/g.37240 Transcript_18214/m.37240 type:complete len:255 (-) Transcript_18214:194-958(-)
MAVTSAAKLRAPAVLLVLFAVTPCSCQPATSGPPVEICHADLMIANLDSAALSPMERSSLGAALAATIARMNGMSDRDVMTLGHQRSSVNIVPGEQKLTWATIGWFSASQRQGTKATIASLLDECDTPQMTLHIFENLEVHNAIVQTITGTLAPDSKAIVGELKVMCTNVVRGTAADTSADALTAQSEKLFPPWETKDTVAACWGWLFIAAACACPLMLFRQCCCRNGGGRKSGFGHDEFPDSDDDGGAPFSGH